MNQETNSQASYILTVQEKRQIWKDIQAEIICIHEDQVAVNNIPDADEVNHVGDVEPGLPVRRGAAMFINDDADDLSEGSGNYELTLEARISTELALFQHSAGCSLNDPCGNYLCLLDHLIQVKLHGQLTFHD